ncbi:hypothetical protein HZA33_00355, partial [Candidatus Pacearchaeota archaeon]|nr:hypothetical protein [Candidatus Pacearchaeota archaeon]
MTQQNPEFQSYVGKFSARYKKEDSFRDIVHGYLKLGGMKKFGLSVGKVVRPSW